MIELPPRKRRANLVYLQLNVNLYQRFHPFLTQRKYSLLPVDNFISGE